MFLLSYVCIFLFIYLNFAANRSVYVRPGQREVQLQRDSRVGALPHDVTGSGAVCVRYGSSARSRSLLDHVASKATHIYIYIYIWNRAQRESVVQCAHLLCGWFQINLHYRRFENFSKFYSP